MEYKIDYKGYEFIITQNEDGTFNIPEKVRDLEPFGTALKPASEYIVLARKPLSEKSVAENVLKWGTGGINVDGCRVGSESMSYIRNEKDKGVIGFGMNKYESEINEGRFPANLILECICDEVIKGDEIKGNENYKWSNTNSNGEVFKGRGKYTPRTETLDIHTNPMCPCRLLDEQSGVSKSNTKQRVIEEKEAGQMYHRHEQPSNNYKQKVYVGDYSDSGGSSRFFYQAKVSKAERNMGLDGFEEKEKIGNLSDVVSDSKNKVKNNHPTVKPINLMTYLCRLITPEGGIILDPFMGSGSTGISAQLEGFRFVGMEQDKSYFDIAEARIENYEKYKKFIK